MERVCVTSKHKTAQEDTRSGKLLVHRICFSELSSTLCRLQVINATSRDRIRANDEQQTTQSEEVKQNTTEHDNER